VSSGTIDLTFMGNKELGLIQDGSQRMLELEQSEHAITMAFRRGLELTLELAEALKKIRDEKLYEERRYESFEDYVKNWLKLDLRGINKIMDTSETLSLLEEAGLPRPENESQAYELTQLEPEKRPIVWKRVIKVCEKKDTPITVAAVRKAVSLQKARDAEPLRPKVDPELDLRPEAAFSDEALAAIERIGSLCGQEVGEALLAGTIDQLAPREIIGWAKQNDALVKNLVHYLVDLRWSLAKALAYEARGIDGGTTIDHLVTITRSHGGYQVFTHDDAQLTVRILAS